jgi:hypothetical protein
MLAALFLWIRWIIRVYKKKNIPEFVIALFSFLLLIVCIWNSSPFGYKKITENTLIFVRLIFLILTIPPVYFLTKWISRSLKKESRTIHFFILVMVVLSTGIYVYTKVNFWVKNRIWMGENLGINIPWIGSSIQFEIYPNIMDYPNGRVKARVKFDKETEAEVEAQILISPYFVVQEGNDLPLRISKIPIEKIKVALLKREMTGFWYLDRKKNIYYFYEPRIADQHNSIVLFNRKYSVRAELNAKTRILSYQFIPQ